jgi:hypothetical protein
VQRGDGGVKDDGSDWRLAALCELRVSALGHGGSRMSGCKEDVPYAEVFLIPPQPRAALPLTV